MAETTGELPQGLIIGSLPWIIFYNGSLKIRVCAGFRLGKVVERTTKDTKLLEMHDNLIVVVFQG